MLAMEKNMLLASTTQEVMRLRSVELQYYLDHTSSIQTMATLLAGFAFTAFVSMDVIPLDLDAIRWERPTGDFEANSINSTTNYGITHLVKSIDGLGV